MLHRELACFRDPALRLAMAVCSIDRSLQRAMPDRDPDAPDPAPSGPLLSSAYWILFNSTSVFHRPALLLFFVTSLWSLSNSTFLYHQSPSLMLHFIVYLVPSLWILSKSTSDNHQLPFLVILRVVHLVNTSHLVLSISKADNHQLPFLVVPLVGNLVPVLLVVHQVNCHWVLSDSTPLYRQLPSLVLLVIVLLVTSCRFFRAPGRCRMLAVLSGTCVSIYEYVVRHSYVVRAFRTLQSQSRKLMRELGCGPWMLAASNHADRLSEFTFGNCTRFVIDQSLVVFKRVFRILLSQFRKLIVLVPVRMREPACEFLDSWMLQADNYVHRLREELSCSNHNRISIDHRVVLRSLSSRNSQASTGARKLMTLWIGEKSLMCIEGILTICNAFMAVIHMLANDEDEGRKNEDNTMQQSSPIFILNEEQRDAIFARLDLYEISRLQLVCKAFKNLKQSSTLKSLRNTREGLCGPSIFFLQPTTSIMSWEWISYNSISQQWERMPSFSCLPLPDEDLFKDYLIAGSNGLMCLDVGKGSHEALVLYQPLTREKKVLPPLIHRRRPVLIAIIYNDCKNTYKIIVAGSSTSGTEHLSRKTEVYDSHTSCWRESDDIPGPEFALNEYQTGVYVKTADTLYCTGFLPENKGRGILAYNVCKGVWIKDMSCQLPYNLNPSEAGYEIQITNAQLIGYENKVFLFSEQELGQDVTHSIHELLQVEDCEIMSEDGNGFDKPFFEWKRLLSESRNGAPGLLVYPEFECQVHGENQFCIFNTIERSGVLYTIHTNSGMPITTKQKLPPCPKLKENSLTFHSLNSLNFVFELSFKISL